MREPLRVDGLGRHLEDRYGVEVAHIEPLDLGVFRVDRRDGPRWVARAFGAERPLVRVQEDAAILRGLERAGFPAERCAHPEPVSEFLGQRVLVTNFLEDHGPLRPGRPAAILGVGMCGPTRAGGCGRSDRACRRARQVDRGLRATGIRDSNRQLNLPLTRLSRCGEASGAVG
jgi:hypothetical protein